MDINELRSILQEEAYELACQRAHEEGDVDIDRDYVLMDEWTDEYYRDLCKEEGIDYDA